MDLARSKREEHEQIQRTLEELRSAVRREAGYLTESEVPTGPGVSSVRDAADLARISAHLPLQSQVPVIGGVIVLAQRILRLGLRWYINPIVEQQNAFNDSVVRALTELELRQADLARQIKRDAESGNRDEANS
jgi:hypothetical protein